MRITKKHSSKPERILADLLVRNHIPFEFSKIIEGREVDFVVLKDGNVEDLIEVKWGDDEVSKSLQYYAEKLNPKNAVQIVGELKKSYSKNTAVYQSIQKNSLQ